jgi:hypothetical protein
MKARDQFLRLDEVPVAGAKLTAAILAVGDRKGRSQFSRSALTRAAIVVHRKGRPIAARLLRTKR